MCGVSYNSTHFWHYLLGYTAAAKSLQSCPTVRPHRWQPTRLPHPWDSPGKITGVACHFLLQCMKVKSESEVAQLCPTLSDPRDCSLPGSSVHGIFQARVLEWGAIALAILPIGWGLSSTRLLPNPLQMLIESLGCHLCFWTTSYRFQVPPTFSLGLIN